MQIFGMAGWSGSGKTTLILKLIATLRAQGVRVSSIKRTHHLIEIDEAGDDSRRLRAAGATEVLVAGSKRWALVHELRDEPEPRLGDVLAHFADTDLVLVEGFKRNPHPKLEIWRPEVGKPLLHVDDPNVVGIATTDATTRFPIPRFDLDDVAGIARFVRERTGV